MIAACRALGFALAGITKAERTAREAELRAWLGAGKHGSMKWMESLLEERLDPARMLPGAKSVVMVADFYVSERRGPQPSDAGMGRIARYAQGRDYHTIVKKRLHRLADELRSRHPGEEFRSFVDTGPVLEREHAMRAGLGWIGKHTLLIHPDHGSYMVLGGMVTTLELRAAPELAGVVPDSCGTCTRCIDACPTAAIAPYSVDAQRCISYLTIEHPGEIEEELQSKMGEWLFGCDVCQEVCPFNRNAEAAGGMAGGVVHPAYRGGAAVMKVAEVLNWGREGHEAAVRGTAMKRATRGMMKRNALIVIRNRMRKGEIGEILRSAERLSDDEREPTDVRELARKAVEESKGGVMVWKKPRSEEGGTADDQKSV